MTPDNEDPPPSLGLIRPPRWVWPLMLLAFLALSLFQTPQVFTGDILWDERMAEYVPWRAEAARLILDGQFPLWTDRVFGGMPLFTTAYVGVLYPLNALYLVAPPITAANILEVLHTFLALVGMALYLRHWRLVPLAAFVGSLGYGCSTFLIMHSGHISMREAACVAPWVAWLAARLAKKPGPGRAAAFAAALAVQGACGYMQIVLFTVGWVGLEWLARMRWKRPALLPESAGFWRAVWARRFTRATVWMAVGGLIGMAMLAVQILPTLEHADQTPRQWLTLEMWAEAPFPPAYAITFFWPRALRTSHAWLGSSWFGEQWNTTSAAIWALAVVGIGLGFAIRCRSPRWRHRAVMLLGLVVTLALAGGLEGLPFYAALFEVPPFSLFRIPARIMVLALAFGSVLAAHGVHELMRLSWWRRSLLFAGGWVVLGAVTIGLFLLLGTTLLDGREPAQVLATFFRDEPRDWVHGVVPLVFALGVLPLGRRLPWLAGALALLLMAAEWKVLLKASIFDPGDLTEWTDRAAYPLLEDMDEDDIARVYSLMPDGPGAVGPHVIKGNGWLLLDEAALGGYTPLIFAQFMNTMRMSSTGNSWLDAKYLENPAPLELYGVSHIVVQETTMKTEGRAHYDAHLASGRFRVVRRHESGTVLVELTQARPIYDYAPGHWYELGDPGWAGEILWRTEPEIRQRPVPIYNPSRKRLPQEYKPLSGGKVDVIEDRGNYKRLWARAEGDAVIVIRKTWWPGWEYRLPGAKDPEWKRVERAWGIMQGVGLEGGGHQVIELRFEPPGWRTGRGVSLGAVALWLGMVAWAWRRPK